MAKLIYGIVIKYIHLYSLYWGKFTWVQIFGLFSFFMSHDFSHRKEETLVSSIHHNCQYCTHPAKNIVIAHNDLTQKTSASETLYVTFNTWQLFGGKIRYDI